MRVLNVVSVLSAHEGGGNAERTTQLSRVMSNTGVDCTVLTLNIGAPQARREQLGRANLVILPCLNKRFQVPFPASSILTELVRNADVIHLMGFWSLLGVAVARTAEREGVPYVLSPAGALPLFGRSRKLKHLFNWVVGRRLVRQAAGWVAVTASELPDFQHYGVAPDKVVVIPNGVAETDFCCRPGMSTGEVGIPSKQFVLFMGRLNAIKGPDLLLEAFIKVANEYPDVELVFAGPDEGLGESLRARSVSAGLSDRIRFLGFVSGKIKAAIYHAAILVVVPSRSEAMSIVAVEAGICGVPVLMTDQCGLEDIRDVDPGLIVSVSEDALAIGLRTAFRDLELLKVRGLAWQAIVRARFLWVDVGVRLQIFLEGVVRAER